jgi:replicative DNA helicase
MSRSRRAVYVTLELSPAQLFDRLITSTAYAIDPEHAHLPKPITELYGLIKNWHGNGTGADLEALRNGYMDIKAKRAAGLLTILDARGAKLAEIMDAIRERSGPGDLVLLDYIQRLPSVDGAAKEGYERMKAVSDTVINTATRSNCILIAAAQFNRAGTAPGEDDTFTDASFRESGDLEQDAHNAIGLGWKADKKSRFIEILKAREAPGTGDLFDIDWRAEYFYMGPGERMHRKEKDMAKKTNSGEPTPQSLSRGGKH